MTTTSIPRRVTAPTRRRSALGAMIVVEARLFLRDPMGTFFGLLFPALLLLVLATAFPGFQDPAPELGGLRGVDIYTPITISLAIATVALVTLAAVLSIYRERGILRRLATTPVRPARVILASLIVHGAVLLVASALTIAIAKIIFDVAFPASWIGAILAVVLGTASMCTLGMLIAAVAPSAKAASGIGTLVYFPMMFFAGVWTPGPIMPDAAQRIGDFLPLGATSSALQAAWFGDFPEPLHLGVMIAWTVVCGFGATRLFRWE
jgi:ABC-2 type transport system permease protein